MKAGDKVTDGPQAGVDRIGALVLAGARNDGPLRQTGDADYEALLPLAGRPLIQYVLDALRQTPSVGTIGIVGPVAELQSQLPLTDEVLIEAAGGLLDNVERGAQELGGEALLVVTADIPFVDGAAIEDFLARCRARWGRDAYYPVVARADNEAAFPGAARTYFHLREGAFTGGNFVLLRPGALLKARDVFEQAVQLRKNPVAMARLLGFGFIVRFVLRRLSIGDMERAVRDKLGIDGAVVPVPYAAVGFDVDKRDDFVLAEQLLRQGTAHHRG